MGLHLMTLCLFLERDVDPALGTTLHRKMIRRPAFHRLRRATYEWARAVWESYQDEHETVRRWLQESGFDPLR